MKFEVFFEIVECDYVNVVGFCKGLSFCFI